MDAAGFDTQPLGGRERRAVLTGRAKWRVDLRCLCTEVCLGACGLVCMIMACSKGHRPDAHRRSERAQLSRKPDRPETTTRSASSSVRPRRMESHRRGNGPAGGKLLATAEARENSFDAPERTHVYGTVGPKARPSVLWKVLRENYWPHVPVVVGGLVVQGNCGKSLVGLDALTGRHVWQWKRADHILSCGKGCDLTYPALNSGALFLLSQDADLVSIWPASGAVRWERSLAGAHETIVFDCRVVVGERIGVAWVVQQSRAVQISAFDVESGTVRWRRTGPWVPQVVKDGRLYATRAPPELAMLALDSGRTLWKAPLRRQGGVMESLDRVENHRAHVCHPDRLRARLFEVATGKESSALGEVCGSRAGDLVVRHHGERFAAYDRQTGALRWRRDGTYLQQPQGDGFSVADGVIYLALPLRITAVDLNTGRELWSFPLPSSPSTRPVPAAGMLYFSTRDNHDWAIR